MKRKKALCIASVASNLDNFNRQNVKLLQMLGYEITLASNFDTTEDVNSREKINSFIREMEEEGVEIRQIDFSRSLKKIKTQIKSANQVHVLLKNNYSLIHCHSPICAAITRLMAIPYRINGSTHILYTAHGFHFYNGAPTKNWALFYLAEKFLSRFTDVLITINDEDYSRAKEHFHARETVKIHGIGINLNKFENKGYDDACKREELGISNSDIMLLSVGEISKRKNQSAVIKALATLNNPKVHYFIAGMGKMEDKYRELAKALGIFSQVHFLGYRTDIGELCSTSDLFIFPSLQEGLPVALMEAIASKTPVICSNIRGNTDLVFDKSCLFQAKDTNSIAKCIKVAIDGSDRTIIKKRFAQTVEDNYETLKQFDIVNVNSEMLKIYENI